jgi:4-hydroxy-3-polyprenylbenzoate decarboxylase
MKTIVIVIGSKLRTDVTKKLPGEGFKRPWPPPIKMDAAVRNGIHSLFAGEP